MPSQSDRRENTGVLEDIRFMSDQIMLPYDTLSEGKRNNNNKHLLGTWVRQIKSGTI